MTPQQFVARAMALPGLPWKRRQATWAAADCFGILVLWCRHVWGFELGPEPSTDGFTVPAGWIECGPEPFATVWMAWRDGQPAHCGIVVGQGFVLHAEGSEE